MAARHSTDDGDREDDGPLRTCIVARRQEPIENLIRFVADPEGAVVPDLACKLPGRGVWVTLDRASVDTAVKTRAFNRGLKREVKAAPELGELVDKLLLQRASGALAMANKAGQAIAGFSKVETAIANGSAAALLHGFDASEDGAEKLERRYTAMCRDAGRTPAVVRSFTIEQLSLAFGRSNVVHAALKSGGASKHFLFEARRLETYRTARLVS